MPDESRSGRPGAQASTRRVYTGRVLNLDIDGVHFPNGTDGELEIIRHPGASAVVPFLDAPDEADPRVLLIRQYRYAAGRFLYEVPAGRLDAGEAPIDCARRELQEETGCSAESIASVGGFFTTPGFIDEFIHVFQASGLVQGPTAHERDELITTEAFPISRALSMVERGEIVDGKTIVALFLAERRRRA